MPDALDIITDALQMIGVYSAGANVTDADAELGLSILNDMIDSWSNESLTTYAYQTNSFFLQVGIKTYSIGPGGTINTNRPIRVGDDAGSAYLLDQNQNKYPMDVVDQKTWNLRTTANVNSNLPDTLFYDPQYPLGLINIWPTPNMSYQCFFYSYLPLADFLTIDANFSLPPGYLLALKTNLAVAAFPYFKDGNISPIVALRADKALANVKRSNIRTVIAVYDGEIIARGQSTYNIRTDRNY